MVQERREMDLAQAAKGRDGDGLSLMKLLTAKAERGLAARTALFDFTSAGPAWLHSAARLAQVWLNSRNKVGCP